MNIFLRASICILIAPSVLPQRQYNVSDEYLNSYQLIKKYGFSVEKYSVVSENGYIVNLFRIPSAGPPVLLVHGIADSSDSWLVLGPEDSLAFILANKGHDVWLFNGRGNKYSKGHIDNIDTKKYWQFSFEEIGSEDLAATIDKILNVTNRKQLNYVGFSQGTTIFLILCSLKPMYNDKVKHAIMLAPVAWIDKIKYPFIDLYAKNLDTLVSLTEAIGLYELYPENMLSKKYHAKVCRDGQVYKLICELEYFLSYGIRSSNLSPDRFPVIASHIPAGTSANTFVHFLQLYLSKRFQRFDYGKKINRKVYRKSRPPMYEVSLVTTPLSIFASEDDWFSEIDNVNFLKDKLPNVVNYKVFNKNVEFSHIDYVYGTRARTLINNDIVNILS